jgi:hypothetical protein
LRVVLHDIELFELGGEAFVDTDLHVAVVAEVVEVVVKIREDEGEIHST